MTLVVDASAIASVLFGETEGPTIAAHIRGETMIAPQLIDYELANACWKKIRRHRESHAHLLVAFTSLDSLPIKRVEVPPAEVVALALQTGLAAYDASYLWLAMSRDVELVTLDRQLARVNEQLRERKQPIVNAPQMTQIRGCGRRPVRRSAQREGG